MKTARYFMEQTQVCSIFISTVHDSELLAQSVVAQRYTRGPLTSA